ncbi:MAG: hypothetical protein E7373_01435 [Clostridiales bacterium]|nr:hypothetical protein [Clostridiales bacterium]
MGNYRKKNGGLINRLIMGKEKSEGYARASLPSNRWELFWDIFKGRFGKLVTINLLMLVFFIPLFLLLFVRYVSLANYGAIYPFNQPFGMGFQAMENMTGYSENIIFTVNSITLLFLPIVAIIAAIGVAGGAYVIRNMVWTEGIFVSNDFWRGIKQNVKQIIIIALLYSLVFYLTTITTSFADWILAINQSKKWLFIISQVISYLFLAIFTIMAFHMITMCVTYDLKIAQLIRNSFLFTIGLLPQNVFFLVLGAIPFLLLLFGTFFVAMGVILILLFGFSMLLLIWTDFCQWSYDKFINDKVPGAQKNRGIYEKIKESDSGALKQYREQMALAGRSSLSSKPIKPITDEELTIAELPVSFNRNDIEKLNQSKRAIYEDHERYVEEHKNDPEFQQTEEEKQMEKEQEERRKRIEKAKKELSKRKDK